MSKDFPSRIELTDEEEKLLALIDFDPSPYSPDFHEVLQSSCEAAAKLADALLSRKVVPKIRLEYFTDPKLNIGLKKSRKQVFEQNGTHGKDIIRHPHFLPYLHYFIFGPQLPESVIEEFWRQVSSWDMELNELSKFSRSVVRQYELNPHQACEEFYKLALECGLVEYEARIIRDNVRTVR